MKQKEGATIEGIEASIKKLKLIRDEKEKMKARSAELNAQEEYLEQMIISKMRSEDVLKLSTEYGTASISERTYPKIVDFNKFLSWVVKHGKTELLVHNIAPGAWREAVAAGEVIPAVESYKQDTLYFRRAKGE